VRAAGARDKKGPAVFILTEHFSLPAFAKINLSLRVFGRREADGFHEIETIFQTVSLSDRLTFSAWSGEQIQLTCDNPNVPGDESNLILKAANALREKFNVERGARIHLEKRIPSPGGMGGGSADAAIALLGLVHLWQIETSKEELETIGAMLGADVPFFFTGGTALGTGLGTKITPLEDAPKTDLLIVTPNVSVPTAEAYKALGLPCLTKKSSESILASARWRESFAGPIQEMLHNDFEPVIFRLKPEIKRVKTTLIALGADGALMSGSGASVFGVFDKTKARELAIGELSKETSWRVFACSTLGGEEYLEALSPCSNLLR
jgi:4-diphosphocytidyl-2-C-methyl-D-erythritol kinase